MHQKTSSQSGKNNSYSSKNSSRSNKGAGQSRKRSEGVPLRSLTYLYEQLIESGILTTGGFEKIVYGDTKEEKENNLKKSLAQPTTYLQAIIQREIRQFTKEKIPLMIDHELETVSNDWVKNLKRTLESIFFKNQKQNLFQNLLEEIELIRKDGSDQKLITSIVACLINMGLKIVIHHGSVFPALDPEIVGQGKFTYHFMQFDDKLISVKTRSYQGKQRLIQYMSMTKEERLNSVLVQTDWIQHLKFMFQQQQQQEQMQRTVVSTEISIQELEKKSLTSNKPITSKQELFVIEGYNNVALPLATGLMELQNIKDNNVNCIFPLGYETTEYGIWGSLCFKNQILYGVFVEPGDKKIKQRMVAYDYFRKEERLEESMEEPPGRQGFIEVSAKQSQMGREVVVRQWRKPRNDHDPIIKKYSHYYYYFFLIIIILILRQLDMDNEIDFKKFTDYQQALGHTKQVTAIDICQQRNLLVSGSIDCSVKLWNLYNNTFIQTYQYPQSVIDVVFSNDGNLIAYGGVGYNTAAIVIVDITDIEKTNIVSRLRGHKIQITRLAFFNHSNYLISGSRDNTVRVWDYQSKEQIVKLLNIKSEVYGVAIQADDIVIASISFSGIIQIWNIQTMKLLYNNRVHHNGWGISFSNNQKMLVTSSSSISIKLWSLQKLYGNKLMLIRKFKIGYCGNWTVLFSPCSRYIISIRNQDSEIIVFDSQTGKIARLFQKNDYHNHANFIDLAISKNMDIMAYPEIEKIVILRKE